MTVAPPTILIVDDDQGLNGLIGKALKRRGFTSISAFTGAEALACLDTASPDLMLLDLKLPDIDTKTLLDHIAARARPLPFVVITGQGDERVAVEMMKRGALDYLVKDTQFLELVPIVAERTLTRLDRDTRLAATEAALRREHAFSMAVLKAAGALMVVADAEGKILSVNPACERLLGCQLEELREDDFGRVFLAATPGHVIQRQFQKLVDSPSPYEQEAYVTTRNGERRLIAWTITAQVRDPGAV
ncbi:MAG: response regulator, partial [Prosthecobacter sp.]|nr:response regulator [Prosthecobacter sp.]